ncbi:hypothetical protein T12_5451 [Trichinella patagoniensis]|uniref:Uncharacterized protein n=1 Tax=Trichinella patagoniensis TaxID=990121 RepID=A0A0V0Z822_9BILA|nr:hypothetical protein T12_5451 [Trichinella patagoniensis]
MANVHFCLVFNLSGNVIKYGENVSMINASCHRDSTLLNAIIKHIVKWIQPSLLNQPQDRCRGCQLQQVLL